MLPARQRGTFAYYSCPTSDRNPSTSVSDLIGPAVNFDFAVCGEAAFGGFKCLAVSESLDDTTEGYDVVINERFETLSTYVIAPMQWEPCDEDDGPGSGTAAEPYGWAVATWRRWSGT